MKPINVVRGIFGSILVSVLGLFGCGRSDEASNPNATSLVILVPGLGGSQFEDLYKAVKQQCPNSNVIHAADWNGYKYDVVSKAKDSKLKIVLVGHSFGCQTILEACDKLPEVELLVLICPVMHSPPGGDATLPSNIGGYLWIQETKQGVEYRHAEVLGAEKHRIEGGHNDVPRNKEVIKQAIKAINSI